MYCYGCGKDDQSDYCQNCRVQRIAALKETVREWESLSAHCNQPAMFQKHLEDAKAELARQEALNV